MARRETGPKPKAREIVVREASGRVMLGETNRVAGVGCAKGPEQHRRCGERAR